MRHDPAFAEFLAGLTGRVQSTLGDRLVSLVLFGSRARGDDRPDSDVDLLIVCTGLPAGHLHRGAELRPLFRECSLDLGTRIGGGVRPVISPIYKTPGEAVHHVPLYLDLVEDAVMLYDRGGFFAGVLDGLRASLKRLGSRRVPFKNGWYWDLKPDHRPGEVFEI